MNSPEPVDNFLKICYDMLIPLPEWTFHPRKIVDIFGDIHGDKKFGGFYA